MEAGTQRSFLSCYFNCKKTFQGFSCVPYYQCNDSVIVSDGSGLVDIRSSPLLPIETKSCKKDTEICCQEKRFKGVEIPAAANEGEKCKGLDHSTFKIVTITIFFSPFITIQYTGSG